MSDCVHDRAFIELALERVLASEDFKRAKRLRNFLSYIVRERLEGRQTRLKAYSIGISVFDRPASFDPDTDPVVRIEAGRLRRALERYYFTNKDAIRIEVPRGAYIPIFKSGANLEDSAKSTSDSNSHFPFSRRASNATLAKSWRVLLVVLSLVGATSCLVYALYRWTASAPNAGKPVLAVMRFSAAGGNLRAQQIASGISEEVIGLLAERNDIAALSRVATDAFGINTAIHGQPFSVRYVIEGSVLAFSASGIVAVRLVDAENGQVVWSDRYSITPDGDPIELQSNISRVIARRVIDTQGVIQPLQRAPNPRAANGWQVRFDGVY